MGETPDFSHGFDAAIPLTSRILWGLARQCFVLKLSGVLPWRPACFHIVKIKEDFLLEKLFKVKFQDYGSYLTSMISDGSILNVRIDCSFLEKSPSKGNCFPRFIPPVSHPSPCSLQAEQDKLNWSIGLRGSTRV